MKGWDERSVRGSAQVSDFARVNVSLGEVRGRDLREQMCQIWSVK